MTDPTGEAQLPLGAPLLVAARDDSMRRFISLLLRSASTPLVFADDQDGVLGALETQTFPVAVLVSELFGWPGEGVADALRTARSQCQTRTVFVAHEAPGPGWEFVDAFVSLPFEGTELADLVLGLLHTTQN
ncbi:MAG: hypothetical protein WD557_00310 [Dehalococcoidia bacterium]